MDLADGSDRAAGPAIVARPRIGSELADTRLRQVTWPAIGEHRDYIVGAAGGRGHGRHDPPAAAR